MWTVAGARAALARLGDAALADASAGRVEQAGWLRGLGGREWLHLDDLARESAWLLAVFGDDPGRLAAGLAEPTGVTAQVMSMHRSGHARQRATRVLAARPGPLAAAALAVRCFDHVSQVRGDALIGLLAHTSHEEAGPAVAVLCAGARRERAGEVLARYTQLILATSGPAAVLALRSAPDRSVRRWAWQVALAHDLPTTYDAVAALLDVSDQAVRTRLRRWLHDRVSVEQLVTLRAGRSVDGRMLAAERLPATEVTQDRLHALLLDPSSRVRARAQERVGADVASFYRATLGQARTARRCIDELGRLGDAADVPQISPYLAHPSPSLRIAAVKAIVRLDKVAARETLAPLLLDEHPRVAGAASRALVCVRASARVASAAWASALPGSRVAAWQLQVASGGWDRVEASLRAAADPDPELARRGKFDLLDWLRKAAATSWLVPDEWQRARLSALLAAGPFDDPFRKLIAFHAGLSFVADG